MNFTAHNTTGDVCFFNVEASKERKKERNINVRKNQPVWILWIFFVVIVCMCFIILRYLHIFSISLMTYKGLIIQINYREKVIKWSTKWWWCWCHSCGGWETNVWKMYILCFSCEKIDEEWDKSLCV